MTTTTTVAAAAAGQGPRRGGGEAAAAVAPAMVYHPSGMVAPGVVPYMAAPRAPTPAAEVVGNSFVNQFYTILHSSPPVLYRFYTTDSTLIVSGEHGGASDAPTTYRTQRDIHNKVVSMRYDEAQADVKSIDASHTLGAACSCKSRARCDARGRILRATLCNLSSSRRKRMGSLC